LAQIVDIFENHHRFLTFLGEFVMWIGDFQDLISIENLTRFGIGMIV
jgi:hypothetical protein